MVISTMLIIHFQITIIESVEIYIKPFSPQNKSFKIKLFLVDSGTEGLTYSFN